MATMLEHSAISTNFPGQRAPAPMARRTTTGQQTTITGMQPSNTNTAIPARSAKRLKFQAAHKALSAMHFAEPDQQLPCPGLFQPDSACEPSMRSSRYSTRSRKQQRTHHSQTVQPGESPPKSNSATVMHAPKSRKLTNGCAENGATPDATNYGATPCTASNDPHHLTSTRFQAGSLEAGAVCSTPMQSPQPAHDAELAAEPPPIEHMDTLQRSELTNAQRTVTDKQPQEPYGIGRRRSRRNEGVAASVRQDEDAAPAVSRHEGAASAVNLPAGQPDAASAWQLKAPIADAAVATCHHRQATHSL